jgi:hypothetical protein
MNEVKRLARQLPVHKLRMTPLDYVRYLPKAIATEAWRRFRKFMRWVGVEL